ncbi:MAG TPA: iron-containing alcohol dehydrogenase, partial [Verrucomicrobiae bacterium]|nr:iron-containing alcohol dehydrogenase [Verrucomicrobiae bacterium]
MTVVHQVYGYFMPTVNLMGAGAAQQAGEQAKTLGAKKALIVTDAFLNQIGMAAEIGKVLKEAGIEVAVFPGAEPNPTDKNVDDGLAVFQQENCDMIVSLGG